MRIKKGFIIFITILAVLVGNILNFREFINDYCPIKISNVIVTAFYVATWIIVISISIKYRFIKILKAYTVFWLITLIHALLIIITSTTGANFGWAILSYILVMCPWYGLHYYVKDYIFIGILISIFALSVLVINTFFICTNNRFNKKSK